MNKEAQRAELHKTIWRIANDLRGSVDGWDFKTYVLGMLFYRFISENLTAYLNEHERQAGTADFDYATLDDDAAEFGRGRRWPRRASTSSRASCSSTSADGRSSDENLNETLAAGVQQHRRLGGRRRQRGRPQGPLRRPRRRTAPSSAPPWPSATRSSSSCSTRSAISPLGDVRRQHDRRVRRRLRVPDDDVRVERRQVRRRVLHPAGGVASCWRASRWSARPR